MDFNNIENKNKYWLYFGLIYSILSPLLLLNFVRFVGAEEPLYLEWMFFYYSFNLIFFLCLWKCAYKKHGTNLLTFYMVATPIFWLNNLKQIFDNKQIFMWIIIFCLLILFIVLWKNTNKDAKNESYTTIIAPVIWSIIFLLLLSPLLSFFKGSLEYSIDDYSVTYLKQDLWTIQDLFFASIYILLISFFYYFCFLLRQENKYLNAIKNEI